MSLTLSNATIVGRLKLLADEHFKADDGTDVTVTISSLVDHSDIAKQFICFVSGDNSGTDRIITNFSDITGVVSFDTLLYPVTNTDEVCIVSKGYQSEVEQAEQVIQNDMRNRGYDFSKFLEVEQLLQMHIYKTIELACAGRVNDGQDHDVYFFQTNRFKDLYHSELASLVADYDKDGNGIIDDDEEGIKLGQIGFIR